MLPTVQRPKVNLSFGSGSYCVINEVSLEAWDGKFVPSGAMNQLGALCACLTRWPDSPINGLSRTSKMHRKPREPYAHRHFVQYRKDLRPAYSLRQAGILHRSRGAPRPYRRQWQRKIDA